MDLLDFLRIKHISKSAVIFRQRQYSWFFSFLVILTKIRKAEWTGHKPWMCFKPTKKVDGYRHLMIDLHVGTNQHVITQPFHCQAPLTRAWKILNVILYWAAKQQTSWIIDPWWFSVSPLVDLHLFCLTKGFPITPSAI